MAFIAFLIFLSIFLFAGERDLMDAIRNKIDTDMERPTNMSLKTDLFVVINIQADAAREKIVEMDVVFFNKDHNFETYTLTIEEIASLGTSKALAAMKDPFYNTNTSWILNGGVVENPCFTEKEVEKKRDEIKIKVFNRDNKVLLEAISPVIPQADENINFYCEGAFCNPMITRTACSFDKNGNFDFLAVYVDAY